MGPEDLAREAEDWLRRDFCLQALRRTHGCSLTRVKDELECCPSVLAAPVVSDEAARLAASSAPLMFQSVSAFCPCSPPPPKAKSVWEFHRTHRQERRRQLPPPED